MQIGRRWFHRPWLGINNFVSGAEEKTEHDEGYHGPSNQYPKKVQQRGE